MRRHPLLLLGIFLPVAALFFWMRLPAPSVATGQASPLGEATVKPTLTPGAMPTPLGSMPTRTLARQPESDWQRYTSPSRGITFRYPPDWELEDTAESRSVAAGAPLFLDATEGNRGSIMLILERYGHDESGSFAEWVTLNNEWGGMEGMGAAPLKLYNVPESELPESIDQAIYTISEASHNPPHIVWLERNGLVYSIRSTYNRPEDIALIFAIIQTFEFDEQVEAEILASNTLRGDQNTMRQQIAEVRASFVPECDAACQYISYTLELERWKKLPAVERPLVQPLRPALIDDSWQPYTQTLMGLSFRLAPGLKVLDPFAENDLDEDALFDHALTIVSDGGSATAQVMRIELFPYTANEDVPFYNWEAIQDQLQRARNPLHQFEYRLNVPIEWGVVAGGVDDIVHLQDQAPYYRVETFWLRKEGIVFRVTADYPPLASFAPAIISTMQFDAARLQRLRDLGLFAGDERTLAAELVEAWANPLPTVDPQATPTPIPTMTPYPTPIPSPTVRATVTPSQFESPLVNGLKRFQGEANYPQSPPFEVWYDPDVWQLVADDRDGNLLVHQNIDGCTLIPAGWATHVTPYAPLTFNGVPWWLSYFPTTAGEFLAYTRSWENISYTVLLQLPMPIPAVYDAESRSECEVDAEAIIATHKVLAPTLLLPTPTPTPN
jgi:hypothetical protein